MTGPVAADAPIAAFRKAIARARPARGTATVTSAGAVPYTMPPPSPCTTRAAMSQGNVGAVAART
jgi:hypothetical protein